VNVRRPQVTERPEYTVAREQRGPVFWVHVYGDVFDQRRADAVSNREARAWAAELGLNSGGSVSGGGQYGTDGFRHSSCYMFKLLGWNAS
jgi:hypothetical protein